jgi:hypothetical protein
VRELLREYEDIFMEPGGKLERTSIVRHQIDTGGSAPIKQAVRRASMKQQELIEEEMAKMQDAGVVRPSESPWASPIVLVRK